MGISTEILRIKNKMTDTFTSLSNKDVTIPEDANSDNLVELIEAIPYYSCPNGTVWSGIGAPLGLTANSTYLSSGYRIVSNGKILVAVPTISVNRLLYSENNGVIWKMSNISRCVKNYNGIIYANGLWVLNGTYYSTDGITWIANSQGQEIISAYSSEYYGIVHYANNMWVLGSNATKTAPVFYSADGKTWTKTGLIGLVCTLQNVNNVWFIQLLQSDGSYVVYYSNDGIIWNNTGISCSGYLDNFQYHNGIYFSGVCYNRNDYNVYSTNLRTWQQYDQSIQCITYNDGLWVCSTTTGFKYSYNGVDWTDSNITSFSGINKFEYFDGIWVAYNNLKISSGTSYASKDGKTWVKLDVSISDIKYNHGIFLALSYNIGNSEKISYTCDVFGKWHSAVGANGVYTDILCVDNKWMLQCAYDFNYASSVNTTYAKASPVLESIIWEHNDTTTTTEDTTETE